MKSIAQITEDAKTVHLSDAIHELEREQKIRIGTEQKPGGAYTRWADNGKSDFRKERNYEVQTARLIAARLVLETMDEKEFKRRLFAATQGQAELF